MKRSNVTSVAKRVATVGIAAATLECGKLALAAIPNVEVVTLLTAIYGYTFGVWGVLASVVFVCIEPLIWGFGSWFITYLIYWPLLAVTFAILGRLRIRSRILLTATALVSTLFFGVLSSLVDVGLFMGYFDRFLYRFGIYYMRGIAFYAIQLATNAVIFPILFIPMHRMLKKIK
jgi:energy-coupling factor transport system substrate-specific component